MKLSIYTYGYQYRLLFILYTVKINHPYENKGVHLVLSQPVMLHAVCSLKLELKLRIICIDSSLCLQNGKKKTT